MRHWIIVALFAALAAAAWMRWPTRFSLRTLLIAITLVALALELIVFMNKTPTTPPLDVGDFPRNVN